MKIIDAFWEQRNIGLKTFEITIDTADTLEDFKLTESQLISNDAEYLVVKTPVNLPEFIFDLPQLGYTFIETSFSISLSKDKYVVPSFVSRLDRGVEVKHVVEEKQIEYLLSNINSNLFDTDRISIDPYFTKEQSSNRYLCWTRDMITSGCKLFNVSIKNKDIGFFINKEIDQETVYPVLAGLYPEYKDKGVGVILMKKCYETIWNSGYKKIESVIVSNNLPILKIWNNFGTQINNIFYVYIKHI